MTSVKVKPPKGKVKRMAMLSTSRDGESLDEFKDRMSKAEIHLDGEPWGTDGIYYRKYIPRFGEERWVTKIVEKHYA